MNKSELPDFKKTQSKDTDFSLKAKSIMPGFNTVLKINHAVRKLIFDYALVAAILGLFRFKNDVADTLVFVTLLLLNLVMAIHISRYWRTFQNQKLITASNLFLSFLSSFVIAVLVRALFSILSIFIPLMIVFHASVSKAVLTLLFGRATNQLFLSAKKIDRQTLEEILRDNKTNSLLTNENEI